jgi:alpha-tubulin suppressor-like RCC1 family protein
MLMLASRWIGAALFSTGCYLSHERTPEDRVEPEPADAGPPGVFLDVAVGQGFACALADDGRVFCWGHADWGGLGDGEISNERAIARAVSGIDDVTAIAVGNEHACALRSSGEVWCWGANFFGQLGTGAGGTLCVPHTDNGFCSPVPVRSVFPPAVGIAAGGAASCAWTSEGEVHCVGYGDTHLTAPPIRIAGVRDIAHVAVGSNHGRAALSRDGTLYTWGGNANGQAGQGATGYSAPARAVATNIAQVAVGEYTTYAIDMDGHAWRAGITRFVSREAGGATWQSPSFIREPELDHLSGLRGDRDIVCGLETGGIVVCGGSTGERPDAIPRSVHRVQWLEAGTSVVDAGFNACAIVGGSEIWCWGMGGAGTPGWYGAPWEDPERVPFER